MDTFGTRSAFWPASTAPTLIGKPPTRCLYWITNHFWYFSWRFAGKRCITAPEASARTGCSAPCFGVTWVCLTRLHDSSPIGSLTQSAIPGYCKSDGMPDGTAPIGVLQLSTHIGVLRRCIVPGIFSTCSPTRTHPP